MSYYVVDAEMGLPWDVAEAAEGMRVRTVARCPTRDAAEAARRLLSGECARAKEEPPLPVCGVCLDTRPRCARPVPCDKCRDGLRPFCREPRCDCECHERRGRVRGELVRTVRWPEWVPSSECLRRYNEGKADGAAQERARIVAFAKTYVKSPIRADVLAEMIERGEAGE